MAPRQNVLAIGLERFDDPPKTEFTLQRTIDDPHMEVYRCFHEFVVRRSGRAQGVEFTSYIEKRTFPAFYHPQQQLLMLQTTKDVASSAMKELVKAAEVKGGRREINLHSIMDRVDRFRGAWFSVEDSADVTSQAFYGPSVDRDLKFTRAASEGEMYNMSIGYSFRNEAVLVGVSNDCNVVVYDDNLDEVLELLLVLDVKARLLDQAEPRV